MSTVTTAAPAYSLGQLVRYMLRLGAFGFGGPVALAGYMRRDLVERLGWILGVVVYPLVHSHAI